MVACFRGCCDTATQTNAVTVKGPLATFSTSMDCDSPHVYIFTGILSDALTWDWNFGDGNSVNGSTAPVISHSYTASGNYWVYLTAYNPGTGCKASKDSVYIHVRDIKADFLFDTTLCSKVGYNFDGSPSVDVNIFGNNGYTWLWDNSGPTITASTITTHSFSPGYHTVTLIVRDINGCPDTVKKVIRAFSVVASFTCSQLTICSTDTITFTNTSTADTTITGYTWVFGDGSTSNQQNPTHIYTITNTTLTADTVRLYIVTALGCIDSSKVILSISRPSAAFSTLSTVNICAGDSVHFNKPTTYPTMNWNFGDGNTQSGGNTPWHPYALAGSYTVTLFIMDALGCTDVRANAIVSVQNKPQVYITSPAFQTTNLCYPYQATFTDSSFASVFSHRIWNLGTGQTVNNALVTVGTIYPLPGTYTVTLVEFTTNGCVDSTKRTLTLFGPIADFDLGPAIICKGQNITFNIKDTTDVFTWHWDFGDGKDTLALSPVTHTYNSHPPGGTTNVTLVYWSNDSTCVQTKIYPVNIYQVVSDFKRNNDSLVFDTAHCLGITDQFNNFSLGADTYGWTFGDGSSSTVYNPQHQYTRNLCG